MLFHRMFLACCAAMLALASPAIVGATAGDLDPSFGGIGRVTYSSPPDPFGASYDEGHAVAIQSDGKIVLAGSFAENNTGGVVLLRRNVDGTPDASFGSGGVVFSTIQNSYRSTLALAIQSDGMIVLADTDANGFDFTVERYQTNGTLDPGFGTGGVKTTDVSGIDSATDVAIQSDGKILVTGPAQGYGYGLAVLRLNANGTVDTGFGTNGVYANGALEGEQSIVIQSDGRIVVGGTLDQGCAPCGDFALLRLTTNGTLDTTFGNLGIASTNLSGADRIKDLALQPDDSIVAIGGVGFGFSGAGLSGVARFTANGALDGSFGTGGKVILDIAPSNLEEPEGVIVEPNGSITFTGSGGGAYLARLTSAGVPDATFGTNGILVFSSNAFGGALARQSDGRLVVGGQYNLDFAIWRLFNNTCPDGTVEPGEECDDANLTNDDGCDANCTTTGCGNGIQTGGEGCDDGNLNDGDGCSSVCQIEPTPTPTPTATTTATRTTTPTPTPTLTPSPTPTPACGDGLLSGGEECDDGNILDGDCCSSTCQLTHHPECLDHYLCYQAKTTAGTTKFAPVTGVALVDRFGATTAEVKAPNRLCAPADENGADPTAPSHPDHLEGYPVKSTPKFAGAASEHVVNQFGSLTLAVKKSVGLFVPTEKSHVATPPAPVTTLDHFQCYQAKVASGAPKFQPQLGVTVQDQFGTMTVDVKKPTRLCVPVDKNGETPGAATHPNHLVCYQVKQTSLPKFVAATPLYVHNQLGTGTRDAKKLAELCVPSYANPTCGNGVIDPGEQCDGGACCTPTCTFVANSPCLKRFSGVATHLPIASLTGWTTCYVGEYDDARILSAVFPACDKANLLMGCRVAGSDELLVAAHAPRTDVLFDTGTGNTPHDANGVGWYYNSDWSWGFAPQGLPINRNQCDLMASNYQGGTHPDERMCWYTNNGFLVGGWRCGPFDELNTSTAYERLIFEAP